MLQESDIVSLHLPYRADLENFIGEKELLAMKQSAILINTASEILINNQALYEALSSHKILGAGLDVFSNRNTDNPLLKLDNVIFTPHEGYLTDGSTKNMSEMVVQNVEAFVKNKPINLIN